MMPKKYGVSLLATIAILLALSSAHGSMAQYQVTFQGLWNEQDHPTNFPPGDHFTTLIGGTHNDTVSFWDVGAVVGTTAAPGIEHMAELGSIGPLQSDVNDEIDAGRANAVLIVPLGLGGGLASGTADITVDSSFPLVTLTSMVAPSPDWFVGVSGLNLLDEQNSWRPQVVVDLYAHDAGTEDGTGFSLGNDPTMPHEAITQLHGSEVVDQFPFVSAPRLATLTFTLVPEPTSLAILAAVGTTFMLRRTHRVQV